MMRRFILLVLAIAALSFAGKYDYFFQEDALGELCLGYTSTSKNKVDAEGYACKLKRYMDNVRIRVVDPVADKFVKSGKALTRPFFILDGIYLSPEGKRTLSDLEDEANRLGIMDVLVELGYTPVLVQFAETVVKPLKQNAQLFAKLLKFLNSNTSIGFVNKLEDGMVVMGISQGGILGRYGAYLYDKKRNTKKDAPIRLYASLDSLHQGAILPLSLYYTIDFWAGPGGSSAAEAFKDLIDGPGASELLLYDSKSACDALSNCTTDRFVNTSDKRFLFGEYREAAAYKGFPSVLVAQGQLKGKSPKHSNTYFTLKRSAKKAGVLMGQAVSEMYSPTSSEKKLALNSVYERLDRDSKSEKKGAAKFDFIQGSTYPFAETLYNSLRAGFMEAMPKNMKIKILGAHFSLSTGWNKDTLIQKNSTFIPTGSAMDLLCDGELSMRTDCAFSQTSKSFPFTKPGTRSSANAVYAVDPTHPRYNESISGRHIELPAKKTSKGDSSIVNGFRVDMWRILCELANRDYDSKSKAFRNENLAGSFTAGANCMDQSKIPLILKKSTNMRKNYLAYSKYDYTDKKPDSDNWYSFDVPAGWHKVALYDDGGDIPDNSSFEVDIRVDKAKGKWLKAELLLSKNKNGSGQVQLHEIDIPLDGTKFVARWQLPAHKEDLSSYRWFRLALNSDGAMVSVKDPRLVRTLVKEKLPKEKVSKKIYPNQNYEMYPWSANTKISTYSDALGNGFKASFKSVSQGMHFDFGGMKSLNGYTALKVVYWPGTCQNTAIYFDSFAESNYSLKKGKASGNFESKDIPLSKIVDVSWTPENKFAAYRLAFHSKSAGETCIVKSISLH